MHCRNCGKEVAPKAVVCVSCGMRPQDGDRFCPSCAAPTQPRQAVCVKCGVALQGGGASGASGDRIAASDPPKDPVLMGVLSGCCIAGLSQTILGQTVKGIVFLVGSIVLAAASLGMSLVVTAPVAGIDAYLVAKKLKEGRTVGPWEFF